MKKQVKRKTVRIADKENKKPDSWLVMVIALAMIAALLVPVVEEKKNKITGFASAEYGDGEDSFFSKITSFISETFFGAGENPDSQVQVQKETPDQMVSIPEYQSMMGIGESSIFRIGVYNSLDDKKVFAIQARFLLAYDEQQKRIGYADPGFIDKNWVMTDLRHYEARPQMMMYYPMKIKVADKISQDHETQKGIYIFDVCVCQPDCASCSKKDPNIYGGDVKKIYIKVS